MGYTRLQEHILNRDYDSVLASYVQTDDMNELNDRAYSVKRGYAIGRVRDSKILFVSGSRNLVDWTFNLADDFIPTKMQFLSNRTARRLTDIFKENDCDVAVGHSRGGALVAKMAIPNYKKLGIDAAMRLAPKNKRNMMNLYQNQILDRFIAQRGENQKKYKIKGTDKYHFLSRDTTFKEDRRGIPKRF